MQTLISQAEVKEGVGRLARDITAHYGDGPLIVLGVLVGSLVFLSDLIRQLSMPMRIGLIQARSYRGESMTPGQLTVDIEMLPDVRGKDVLLVDDIFDTGQTMARLLETLRTRKPRTIRTAVLLRKRDRCQVHFQPDHVGFDIPDRFVVGYGLDYNDQYRNLPYVAALEETP